MIIGDLAQADSYPKLTGDYDYICHLAGQSSGEISFFDNPVADLEKNTIATLNLIRFGIEKRVGKLVYASSMSVYGQPDMPTPETACYCLTKLLLWCRQACRRTISTHFCAAIAIYWFSHVQCLWPGSGYAKYASGHGIDFLAQALNHEEIVVKGALDRYRDFIFIDDVVIFGCRRSTMIRPIMIFTILAQGDAPLLVICWTPFKKPPAHAISASLAARRATSSEYIRV